MVQKLDQTNAEITLGYWGIRGLAQPIRFLLIAAGIPFSEIRLGLQTDGMLMDEDDEGEDWDSHRATLDLPFPNLPYLIDNSGDSPVRLSQSNAILRYLARRFDFYGDSDHERTEIDVLQDEAYDFRNQIIDTAYTLGDDYAAAYEEFCSDAMPQYLDSFERYLSRRDNKKYFVGSRLSLVDFVLYELFWQMTLMVPGSISPTARPTLQAFIQTFEQDAAIAGYLQSDNYIEHPINSHWASFA
ncbi:MAG: glutathione S-transferase [Planctomycetota bacterium]|jgi:glutathione S-transferase